MSRVLMLSSFYAPFLGGEELSTRNLSLALAASGHEVSVATLWHEGLPELEMDHDVRVHRIPSSMQRLRRHIVDKERVHLPPLPDPEAVAGLRRVIAEERPEIVHAHNWLVHSFLPLKAWSGAKLVLSLHDYSLACANTMLVRQGQSCSGPELARCVSCSVSHFGPVRGSAIALAHRAVRAPLQRMVDRFVCVSQAVADGNGLVAQDLPYDVIPNFIRDDGNELTEDHASLLAELPQEPFILFVGAFAPHKGVDVLLRAYEGLENAPPLVMIGYTCGDAPADLPPNVHAFANWPHTAVMEAWRRCAFGVAPSVWPEPFGNVLLESMSSGRPMIASRMGGMADVVVDGKTGYLVPPGDASALQDAMQRLVDKPDLRDELGQAALDRVEMYRPAALLPRFEQIYGEILRAPAAAEASSTASRAVDSSRMLIPLGPGHPGPESF